MFGRVWFNFIAFKFILNLLCMDSLLAPESLFSAIGSGTQRLFSLDAKFSEFEIERPSSEMESDIDIIAALIVIPRSVTSIGIAFMSFPSCS